MRSGAGVHERQPCRTRSSTISSRTCRATARRDLVRVAGTLRQSTTCPTPPARSRCSTSSRGAPSPSLSLPDKYLTATRDDALKTPPSSGSRASSPRVCACTAPSIRPPAAGATFARPSPPCRGKAANRGHRHRQAAPGSVPSRQKPPIRRGITHYCDASAYR